MNGAALIDSLMYSVGKVQTKATDTNYRTIALDWLNLILKDVNSRQPHWKWLEKTSTFDTVATQMSYDLPTDIDEYNIYDMRQTESPAKLIYIPQRRLDSLDPDPTTNTGDPTHWTVFADSLRLYPVPSQAITITMRHLRLITAATDAATALDIPDKYSETILNGLKIHGYNYEPEWGSSADSRIVYELGIDRMIKDNSTIIDDDGISESHAFIGKSIVEPYPINVNTIGQ